MRVFAYLVGAALLLGCGAVAATDEDKSKCHRAGGTFIEHSDGSWECQYPPRGVDDGG